MREKSQTWKEFWNLLATSSDPIAATDRPTVLPEIYRLYSTDIIQKLALHKDDVVLNIGCGTGMLDADLAAHVQSIFAIDFSEVMTQKARLNTASCGNVRIVTGDCTALPFENGTFSKVLMYAVAQYLTEAQISQMLREVQRISRPGGLIMLGEIPRTRDMRLWSRLRDVWTYEGPRGTLRKTLNNLLECWLRMTGRWTRRFVRPEGPPVKLYSKELLLGLVYRSHMRGQILLQSRKLPWFHQTFDLLIENVPPSIPDCSS